MDGNWTILGALLVGGSVLAAGVFGFFYDRLVAWVESEWPQNANTADLVIVGVGGVLLIAAPTLGLRPTVFLFALFAASGFFMAAGSKRRYNERQKAAEDGVRAEIAHLVESADAQGEPCHDDA